MQDVQDLPLAGHRVEMNLSDDLDLLDWADRLGVSLYEIRVAAAEVGPDVALVKERLKLKLTR